MSTTRFEIDPERITVDDLEKLDCTLNFKELLDFLDRIVIDGVRGKGYNVTDLRLMLSGVKDAIRVMLNPQDGAGKN